jgi:hypothetical protein
MLSVIAVIKICEMFIKPVISIKTFLGMTILILNFCSVHLNELLVSYFWCCTWVSSYVRSVQINDAYAFLEVFIVLEYHISVLFKLMIATLSLQLVSYLGIVIFHALDFGLSDEEERHLSPDLERLIDMMTAAGKLLLPFSLVGRFALKCLGTNLFVCPIFFIPAVIVSSIFCTVRLGCIQ